ncbi:MAG: ATP-binding protein, partial [Planctomycetaceae bacterium]
GHRIARRRRELSGLRQRFRLVQRELADARQSWCAVITGLGLAETLRTADAFDAWQHVVEAKEQFRVWQAADEDARRQRQSVETLRRRIEQFGRRMHHWDFDSADPIAVLAAWEEELKEMGRRLTEQRRLKREEQVRRRGIEERRPRIDELTRQCSALLVQGGAADREEFEQRAGWVNRRAELEEYLSLARAELETAAEAEKQLAIVEDDLEAYTPEGNGRRIASLTAELEGLEHKLQQAFESLGRIKQEIAALESDRRQTKLRFDRSQIQGELKRAAEEWFAVQLAGRAVDRLRAKFERTCQPAILAASSKYLEQLTSGKYKNVWTPLGKRHLCIDDEHGRSLRVEQLSNGTREQLFLAIRLAMAREFADRGVELPMVLDDVIVNFDQQRTEAAIDCLSAFAERGPQVLLFTCHLHIARLCESRGLNPIWLPGHAPQEEQRQAG